MSNGVVLQCFEWYAPRAGWAGPGHGGAAAGLDVWWCFDAVSYDRCPDCFVSVWLQV